MADDPLRTTDYLGREAEVSFSGKPSLPVGGLPAGVSAAPATSGTGTAPASPATLGVPLGVGAAAAGAAGGNTDNPQLAAFLSAGGKLGDLARKFFGGGAGTAPLGLTPGESSAQGGQGGVAAGVDEAVNQGLGGGVGVDVADIPPGSFLSDPSLWSQFAGPASEVAGAFGPLIGGGLAFGKGDDRKGALTLGGGVLGGIIGMGPGGAAIGSTIGSLIADGLNAVAPQHSEEWMKFPGEVGKTFQLQERANMALAEALAGAQSEADVMGAISTWKAALQPRIGGFGAGSGPLDIPDEPGAGYNQIHGLVGMDVDFSPEIAGLRALKDSALAGSPLAGREEAFRTGAQGALNVRAQRDAARNAAMEKLAADQSEWATTNTGSA